MIVAIAMALSFALGVFLERYRPRILSRRRTKPRRTPEPTGILASFEGVDTVCVDCGAHHLRHPAMREMRCKACVQAAFDAAVKADADDQADWLRGDG